MPNVYWPNIYWISFKLASRIYIEYIFGSQVWRIFAESILNIYWDSKFEGYSPNLYWIYIRRISFKLANPNIYSIYFKLDTRRLTERMDLESDALSKSVERVQFNCFKVRFKVPIRPIFTWTEPLLGCLNLIALLSASALGP